MPNNYPPEFRRQMVELVRAGRTPEELAKEFQPSAQSIRTWVRQADLDDGRRQDGLTSAEKDELARLLGVSRQGYYAWAARRRCGPSARARRDAELTERNRVHHQASDEIYG
ncbi:transposase [Nonomuraea wenchangensis]|uniref:Transposase n=1 Tax=Nonomuraea wenchangensis TaxID=568860 RepID=A0A1I0L416_9ACTN|nr:transposase [Nonomuraea wenchangensis]SEU34151.1 Transposase [Nonomuraea wenchangensis]